MLRKLLTLTFAFLLSAGMAFAQSSTITGTVVDAQSGEPLAGANVFIQGLSTGAATNANGIFEIEDVAYGTYTFRTTFVGYRTITREVEVNAAEQTLNFELQADLQNLEEVVVSGIAGETSRAVSQISVSKVNAEDLQEANTYSSVSELLTGKAAGVNIVPASGNPGGGVRFNIRAGGSLSGNGQPVIYIDGTRINNAEVEGLNVGGQGIGVLSDLNPNDIASVEILKGPAAAALYGSRGSNGVVLIETKSGQGIQGSGVNVDFRSSYGINTKQAEYDDILSADEANETIDSNPFYDNTVSVSGGTEYVRYFTSLNQRYEEGLGPVNSQDRQSFRGNFEAYPNDNLTVRANTSYTLNEIERPQNDNNTFGVLGNLVLAPGGSTYFFLPKDAILAIEDNSNFKRFIGSVSTTWTPIENLNFNGSIGYDNSNLRQTQFFSPDFNYGIGGLGGDRSIFNRDNEQITYDASISYLYNPTENLQVTSVVGTQIFNQRTNNSSLTKQGFPSSQLKSIESGLDFITSGEFNFHSRDAGLFTQHDFNFDDTYFVSLGGRLDYASAVGVDAPQIFYPQARAAVRLDQFNGFPDAFDLFKVRAAYGETGELPALFDGVVNPLIGGANYGVGVGAIIEEIGNPEIKPERVKELEIGLDVDFLDNYGAQITYYNQQTEDAIIDRELAPSTGLTFDDRPFNVGKIQGQGVEFGFNGTPVLTENTQLDFNITAAYSTNEVEDLGGAQPIFDGFDLNVIRTGLPRSAFYVQTVDGAARDENGDILLRANGLPVPNVSAEREFQGQPYPEYNGSFSMTFRFLKNFELYQLWDWATGLSVYNNTDTFKIQFSNDQSYAADVEAYSAASSDPTSDEFKRLADKLAEQDIRFDDNFIEDADYLKLREVSLSYNFSDVLANSGLGDTIRNIRLSVAGRNLLTFTPYSGIDPEVNFTGARSLSRGQDFLTLQVPRTFYGTINIGF